MTGETSQTLDRGLRLLEQLAGTPGGLTVTELATRLGVNRTVVYRLLATLGQHGLVRRDAGGRYRTGLAVMQLARTVTPLLRDAARPVLRRLAEQAGATAHLSVADGDEALAMVVVEPSWTDVHVSYRVGSRHPLHRGAAGRAILLLREPDVGGQRPAYVTSAGELQPGAHGLAAPLHGIPSVEASIGVIALADLDPDEVAPLVIAAAEQLAKTLQ